MSGPMVLALRLLLTLALYSFLGLTLWIIWQDIKRTSQQAAPKKIPAIRLEFQTGKRAAVSRTFSQPEISIGRDPSCDIPLDEPTVSARHAKLSHHHGQWWVEDLNSTNGTTINDEKLTTATVLTSGDGIQCGKAPMITVSLGGEAIVPPAQRLP